MSNNDSARELMQQDKLRELAVVLTQKIRENATIDWTIKESVRAKLKVIVKRILRQYGYPPDMQLLATETVLKQAEMIARELAGSLKGYNPALHWNASIYRLRHNGFLRPVSFDVRLPTFLTNSRYRSRKL